LQAIMFWKIQLKRNEPKPQKLRGAQKFSVLFRVSVAKHTFFKIIPGNGQAVVYEGIFFGFNSSSKIRSLI